MDSERKHKIINNVPGDTRRKLASYAKMIGITQADLLTFMIAQLNVGFSYGISEALRKKVQEAVKNAGG